MIKKEEDILNSALSLFVSKGFHGTSTASIANNADVSNGTLFHYYRSKDSLVQKLHAWIKEEQIEAIMQGLDEETNPKDQCKLIWRNAIDWAMKNKEKYHFLHVYKYSPYRKKHKGKFEQFKTKFSDIVEKGIQQKQLRYLPDDFVYDTMNASVYGMIEYLENNPVKYRTPEFMKQAFEMFWGSVKA